jgi:hypothetical protein
MLKDASGDLNEKNTYSSKTSYNAMRIGKLCWRAHEKVLEVNGAREISKSLNFF